MFILCLLFLCGCGASSVTNYTRTLSRYPRSAPSFADPTGLFLLNQFHRGNYDVTFYIRQPENQCQSRELYSVFGTPFGEILVRNSIQQVPIDTRRKLVILIHGYLSNSGEQFPSEMADALCRRNTNVVLVDWRKLAAGAQQILQHAQNFPAAVNYVTVVAGFVTRFMLEMKKFNKLDHENTHVIGHSLGSYVACYGARLYTKLTLNNDQIKMITMLDPPTIAGIDSSLVVDLSDAWYIDTIWTSFVTRKGTSLGHVNFYINPNSWTQPPCWLKTLLGDIFCSHSFAHMIYLETIMSGESFSAKKCPCSSTGECDLTSCHCGGIRGRINTYMGYSFPWLNHGFVTREDVMGVYTLTTNTRAPYAKHNCPFVLYWMA